jgi:hypothetical protein
MAELEIKTGRHTADIRAALEGLEKDNYIVWVDKSRLRDIVILEGWDRDQKIIMPPGDANRYFTEYLDQERSGVYFFVYILSHLHYDE